MDWERTAVFWPSQGGYAARAAELPDVTARGATLDETRENLRAAIRETVRHLRTDADEASASSTTLEEKVLVTFGRASGYHFSFVGT